MRQLEPYLSEPAKTLWHQRVFLQEHLRSCREDPFYLNYSFLYQGFVVGKGREVIVPLPYGWAATEILLLSQQIDLTLIQADADAYRNEWGYATYIGPYSLIQALAEIEAQRLSATNRQAALLAKLGLPAPENIYPSLEGKYVGRIQIPGPDTVPLRR